MLSAYIGFSKIGDMPHSGASNAGIAQSDFTYSLLRETIKTEYIACCDNKYKLESSQHITKFYLRKNRLLNIFDAFKFLLEKNFFYNYSNIIVYHSLIYAPFLLLLRLFGAKYILQINELYSKSGTHDKFFYIFLENLIIRLASGYILSTEVIIKHLPKSALKPIICVIPGPIEPLQKKYQLSNQDNKIKLVYAGVIDRVKNGGAFIAAELASRLDDDRFTVDIYGFGSLKDLNTFNKFISMVSFKSKTAIKYCGNLEPTQLITRLNQYDIGLATQYIGTSFSSTSFPSKILTYLSSGINVISATSDPLESWQYKNLIYIYKNNDLSDLIKIIKDWKRENTVDVYNGVMNIKENILRNLRDNLR